ncbi:hypothetical protein RF11_11390 [Thelohanellus kitauei]|uniref:Uncharacterized protein n=1 Tax=Thelohanellus kitauei TaxID=669202 RepID=A0A0C2NL17_THEKT|nr:hypothetical protein RF11_11390 [Thelohanellus kitauei]
MAQRKKPTQEQKECILDLVDEDFSITFITLKSKLHERFGIQDQETQNQKKTKVFMTKEKTEIMKNMIRRWRSTKAIATDLNISEFSARLYKRKIEEGQEALILP